MGFWRFFVGFCSHNGHWSKDVLRPAIQEAFASEKFVIFHYGT